MKKSGIFTFALLMSVSTISFGATLHSLSKNEMTKMFEDSTITTAPLITMDGQLVSNSVTVYHDKQGKLTGKLTNTADGNPQIDEGTWTVKSNGTVCVTWEHWNQKKPICVYGYKVNDGVILVNAENNNFETLILKENMKSGNQIS